MWLAATIDISVRLLQNLSPERCLIWIK